MARNNNSPYYLQQHPTPSLTIRENFNHQIEQPNPVDQLTNKTENVSLLNKKHIPCNRLLENRPESENVPEAIQQIMLKLC